MAFHEISIMDIWEVVRRWHNRQSIRSVAHSLGYDRKTVRGFVRLAQARGLSLDSPLPPKEEVLVLIGHADAPLGRPQKAQALLEPHLEEIMALVNQNEMPLELKSAFEVIIEHYGLQGRVSYSSFKRFARRHRLRLNPDSSTCRREVPAGSEVQIDYARIGTWFDPSCGRKRTVHVFIGTLKHSRHKYAELTFSQDQTSFVSSHVRMFEFFGGVPERIVLDNLKAGVIRPDLYDPSFNRAYHEMAEHYGCFLDPCRVAHPKDKGTVERDVRTVRQAVRKLFVLHPTATLTELNALLKLWACEQYGRRKHGTTGEQPYEVFCQRELPALKPLPQEPFAVATWKQATVHPDHYIQFKSKAYSVPHAYVGRKVWVRGTELLVQIFFQEQLIKQHVVQRGYRHTDFADFPDNIRVALDSDTHRWLLERSEKISPHFHRLIRGLLEVHAFLNLRTAQGLVTLGEHFDPPDVDRTAAFVLDNRLKVTPRTFRELLAKLHAMEHHDQTLSLSDESLTFVRDIDYFINHKEQLT